MNTDCSCWEKVHPIKVTSQNKLFLKSEVLQRKW